MSSFLYSQYGYDLFPRTMGTPYQWEIFDVDTIDKTRERFSGRTPLYISHNAHHKNLVFFRHMMFDFDGEIEEVVGDVRKLLDYFRPNRKLINYTGNGIHVFVEVKPFLSISDDIKIKKFQSQIKQELDLKTLDTGTIEAKKLTRLLLARYVKRVGDSSIRSIRHTIPIREEDLSDLDNVKEMSVHNNPTHVNVRGGELLDASFLVEKSKSMQVSQIVSSANFEILPDQDFLTLARLILKSNTYNAHLYDLMMSVRQSDISRVTAVIALKSFGIDEEGACQFISRISKLANWWDRNIDIQRNKIHQLYIRPYFLRLQ